MSGGPDGAPYYGRARIALAIILGVAAGVLLLIDSLRADYAVDSVQLGLLLGTASVLLGVEAILKRIG